MNKILLTLTSILFCAITFAQNVPQGINYQAIARDAAGAELANDTLTVRFSVLEGAAISWEELHTLTTNDFGMFTAIIGQGTSTFNGSSLTFDLIDWGNAAHSLKVEIDYGNGLADMGTTDFMSVPYSLHAKTAANGSTTDELQTLSISGDTIFLVGGGLDSNFIVLPSASNNPVLDSLTLVLDDNFENYLENNGMGDGVMLNNYVLTSNIQDVTILDISNQQIMDFLGIENFISLQELRCQYNGQQDPWGGYGNGPTSLNLANNSDLTYLDCSNNSINSLLIANCSDLQFLDCSHNDLTYLILSNKPLLEELYFSYNDIYGHLDLSSNVGLTDLEANYNNLTSIDISASTLLNTLSLRSNNLTSIDLSQNTALLSLDLYSNLLTSIDLSQNTALLSLHINYNELITLDLRQNTSLTSFQSAYAPYLTHIDARNGNNVNMNSYQAFHTGNSPNLACVSVDDTLWSNNNTNWRNSSTYYGVDTWTLFSAECNPVLGCTDPTALNHNSSANTDDGSCIPFIYGCTDITAYNYDSLANTNVGCISFIYGCTDPYAFNYYSSANTDDGSCIAVLNGCTDSIAFNYNALANTDDGSCIILGCTDPLYVEYDPTANTDDGSCVTSCVNGCTDTTAFNYNALATCDDGSCIAVINVFNYTGNHQYYTIPAGVTSISIEVVGGPGGLNSNINHPRSACYQQYGYGYNWLNTTDANRSGKGGRVIGTINNTSALVGQTIQVNVGGEGQWSPCGDQYAVKYGGWNGGGDGTQHDTKFQGGGGASDIRVGSYTLNSRIIVAGGGGSTSSWSSSGWANLSAGGAGGGLTGGNGQGANNYKLGGLGGSQTAGGLGGSSAYHSIRPYGGDTRGNGDYTGTGDGGNGTWSGTQCGLSGSHQHKGGGGGGGYHGGGAGYSGGGGSSYTDPNYFPGSSVTHNQGYWPNVNHSQYKGSSTSSHGYIIITLQ